MRSQCLAKTQLQLPGRDPGVKWGVCHPFGLFLGTVHSFGAFEHQTTIVTTTPSTPLPTNTQQETHNPPRLLQQEQVIAWKKAAPCNGASLVPQATPHEKNGLWCSGLSVMGANKPWGAFQDVQAEPEDASLLEPLGHDPWQVRTDGLAEGRTFPAERH